MRHRYFANNQRIFNCVRIVTLLLAQDISAAPATRGEALGWQETPPAIHTRIDVRRNRLWILDGNAVYLYEAATKQLIGRVELPERSVATESCVPELALTPSGAALVTSNVIPTIWEIDPRRLVVRQHRLSLDADNDKDVGFTGLAFSADGKMLLGVSSLLGSVWTIDLIKDSAHKVPLSEPVRGACGLVLGKTHGVRGKGAAPVPCIRGPGNAWRVEFKPPMRHGLTISDPCSG